MAKARVAGWTCDEWLFVQSGKILGTLTTDGALDVSDTEDLSIGAGVTHVGTGSVVLGELSSRPSMTPDVLRAKPRSVVEWRRMADYLLTHGGGTGIELVTDVGGITKEMKDRLGEALAKYKEMRDSEE